MPFTLYDTFPLLNPNLLNRNHPTSPSSRHLLSDIRLLRRRAPAKPADAGFKPANPFASADATPPSALDTCNVTC